MRQFDKLNMNLKLWIMAMAEKTKVIFFKKAISIYHLRLQVHFNF